jgi:hypothetical protein
VAVRGLGCPSKGKVVDGISNSKSNPFHIRLYTLAPRMISSWVLSRKVSLMLLIACVDKLSPHSGEIVSKESFRQNLGNKTLA